MMEQEIINVDHPVYLEMCEAANPLRISELKPIKSVMFKGESFIIVGGISIGSHPLPMYQLDGYRFTELDEYTGELKPLTYHKHNVEVRAEKRERCYNGMIVHCDGREVVMIGNRIKFLPIEKGKQVQLF